MKETTIAERLHMQFYKCNKLLKRSAFEQRMEHIMAVPYRGQGKILRLLLDKGEMSQKDIVIEMDIRPSTAWELVGKLEKAGFVEKIQNPDDKRGSIVKLTEKGKREAMSAKWDLSLMASALYSGLTEPEQAQLSDLLAKLILSLQKSESETGKGAESDAEDDSDCNAEAFEFFEGEPRIERKIKCEILSEVEEGKQFFKTLFKDLGFTKKKEKTKGEEPKSVIAEEMPSDTEDQSEANSEANFEANSNDGESTEN